MACGSDGTQTKMDSGVQHDAPSGGGSMLTVKNYLSWCSVSVNGGTASTAATQMVTVTPGAIPLTASPASASFALSLNMWHHTDGDTTGNGDSGAVTGMTSATTATVTSSGKCVWVCCPFTNGTGCEPTIGEQCP